MYEESKRCIEYMIKAKERYNLNHDLVMISNDYLSFINQRERKHLTCKTVFNNELIEFLINSNDVNTILQAENIVFATSDYIRSYLKDCERIL